jgi:hypothetical protein
MRTPLSSPLSSRSLRSALALCTATIATICLSPTSVFAAECPNEVLRSEANSAQLPQCRAYELVSPQYTADSGLDAEDAFGGTAPDGEAVQFYAEAGFAGAGSNYGIEWYVARRGVEGWKTHWVGLPASQVEGEALGTTISFDMSKDLVFERPDHQQTNELYLTENTASAPAFTFKALTGYQEIPWLKEFAEPVDETPDFSHVILEKTPFYTPGKLMELSGVGGPGPEPPPQAVNIGPEGSEIDGTLGRAQGYAGSIYHAVSNDGSEVFFTSAFHREGEGVSYVRLMNESKTLPLGGLFQGASEEGSKVFVKVGLELYVDAIDSKPGQEAVTKKDLTPGSLAIYLRSSDDGSHVYFLSSGVLAENENENKEKAETGSSNLYVYNTESEKAAFIAHAVPGGNIFGQENIEAQVNGCLAKEPGCEPGRFFVFVTTAKITPDDTSSAQQVFEYDASTGRLVRVSLGEDGYDDNGNGGEDGATISSVEYGTGTIFKQEELFEENTRAVSDDGSTVVFTTSQPLSPRAINGQPDIYEWHDGQVGMISTGHSPTFDAQPTITPSGRDIFFTSTENIVPQDSDGLTSLYDARIDGGFRPAPEPAGGCTGDSCQGPPSVPELLTAPASATFTGLGNPVPPTPSEPAVKAKQPKLKPKPKKSKPKPKKKKKKRGGKAGKSMLSGKRGQ